jgi:hypothetical protein
MAKERPKKKVIIYPEQTIGFSLTTILGIIFLR